MDNARIHNKLPKKHKIGKEEIIIPPISECLASRNIQAEFITPYFPQLNPVEELFNVIKGYIRRSEPRTKQELEEDIGKVISELQKKDLTKFFKNCLDYKFVLKINHENGN